MENETSRLPQEILHRIFVACVDTEWTIEQLHDLAQVCRSWSDAIFSCARLWTTISSRQSPQLNSAVLRNSKAMMLTVKCERSDAYATEPSDLMKMAAAHASRVQNLAWSGLNPDEVCGVQTRFPNLLTLYLRVITETFFGETTLLTFSLFDGLPLKSLDLEFIRVQWDSPRLTSLTTLKIRSRAPAFPTLPQLHSMLRASQNLVVLELVFTGFHFFTQGEGEQEASHTPQEPILLGSLKHLSFDLPVHYSRHLAIFLGAPGLLRLRAKPLGLRLSSDSQLPTLLRNVLPKGRSYHLEHQPILQSCRFVAFTDPKTSTSNDPFDEDPPTICCDIQIFAWGLPEAPWDDLLTITREYGYATMPGDVLIDQSNLYDLEFGLSAQDAFPGVVTLSCTDTYNVLPLLRHLSKATAVGLPWPNLRGLHLHYNHGDDSRIRTAVESFAKARCGPNETKRWELDSDKVSLCLLGHPKEGCCIIARLK